MSEKVTSPHHHGDKYVIAAANTAIRPKGWILTIIREVSHFVHPSHAGLKQLVRKLVPNTTAFNTCELENDGRKVIRIEVQANSFKKVHDVFTEAISEFQKATGYTIELVKFVGKRVKKRTLAGRQQLLLAKERSKDGPNQSRRAGPHRNSEHGSIVRC